MTIFILIWSFYIVQSPNSPDARYVFIGDSIEYSIAGYTEESYYIGEIPVASQINGIQIYSIYSSSTFDEINNNGIMYLNEEYYVNMAAYISETVVFPDFYFAFYNGGSISDSSSFLFPESVDNQVGEGIPNFYSGYFKISFTLDKNDNNYIEPGTYQMIVFAPYNLEDFSPEDGYTQIYYPSHEPDTYIFDSTKRGTPLRYIVSFANPTVHLQLLDQNDG